jgi:hypothetical protein
VVEDANGDDARRGWARVRCPGCRSFGPASGLGLVRPLMA